MTTAVVSHNSVVDSLWKDRIERGLKYVCRSIDSRQRCDAM